MLTITKRPLTDDERAMMTERQKALRPDLGTLGCQLAIWGPVGIAIGAMAGGIVGMMVPNLAAELGKAIIIGAIAGFFVTPLIAFAISWLKALRELQAIPDSLEVLHVTVTAAIFVHYDRSVSDVYEDLFDTYAMQVDEKKVLFVGVYFVDELVHQGKFPCREFEVTRTLTGDVLDVAYLGDPLPVSGSYMIDDEKPEDFPQGIVVATGTLNKLPTLLKKYGAQS